jgi:hypothetical protein
MHLYRFADNLGWTGFINKDGDIKIPSSTLRTVDDFYEERAAAGYYTDDSKLKCGYIDEIGNWIIEPKYDFVRPFQDGRAVVGFHGKDYSDYNQRKFYVIDRFGDILWEVPHGITIGSSHSLLPVSDGTKSAYATETGQLMTEFEYSYAEPFNENLGLVCWGKSQDGKKRWSYIQEDGSVLENLSFTADDAYPFTEGFARLRFRKGVEDFYYYINKKGEFMNKTPFSMAGPFSEGRAYVKGAGQGPGVWYINTQFEQVLKPDYKFSLNNYSSGLVVIRDKRLDLFGYADLFGRNVIQNLYCNNRNMAFKNELAYVIQKSKYSDSRTHKYVNRLGEVVFEMNRELLAAIFL